MPEPRPVPEIPAIEQVALPDVVRDADHRIGVDISRIEVADWLAPDETFVDQLREKQRLHAARAPVFDALPESAPAQSELLAMLVEHLPCHHPSLYRREGDALRVVPLDLLVDIDASPLPPLLRAGWLVQEDLCLLDGDAPHRLLAASLSFPSRWRLGDKLGRPLVAIHDPVPGFERTLADPVSRVFARLTPETCCCARTGRSSTRRRSTSRHVATTARQRPRSS